MNMHKPPLPIEPISLDRLCGIIATRASEMKTGSLRIEDSYTAQLLAKGVDHCAKKVGEEAVEAVLEAAKRDKQKFIVEMAQLFYHELVLMQALGVTMAEIKDQLGLVHAQMTESAKINKRGT